MESKVYKSEKGKSEILNFYNHAIEVYAETFEKISVPTRFGDTFIFACGDINKPPLILLHGTASNSATWFSDIIKYSEFFRVYAIDIIGEPGKSAEARPPFDNSYSDWLDDIFRFLNIEKSFMVGMSLGGWIASSFSINHPEKVLKLVLLCPSGFAPQKNSFIFKAIFFTLLGNYGLQKINKMVFYKENVPNAVNNFGILVNKYFKPRIVVLPIFTDSEIKKITFPVYLIVGDKDALLYSKKSAERIKCLLPSSTIKVRKETGHALLNTCDEITKFLMQ